MEFNRIKDEAEVNTMSPLTWAYVGDSVYELYVRTHLVDSTKLKPHMLHVNSIKYVKAEAQANILKEIYDVLSDDEKDIVRRGRNAEIDDYSHATAFEALIGYLYLTKKDERLLEILKLCIK